jgi:drug/metabolite transporter (DMT)-like permease
MGEDVLSVHERLRYRHVGIACLAFTVVGWGLNWPFLKLLLKEWPPLFARGTAGVTAALGLAIVVILRGDCLKPAPGERLALSRAAFTNVFAWAGLSTLSLRWLNVAEAALLVNTMPIWATLLAWPLHSSPPTIRTGVGIGLAIAGIGILLVGPELTFSASKLPGLVLALSAAVLFAAGIVAAQPSVTLSPLALTAWQVGLGCLPMVALGIGFEGPDVAVLSPVGWLSLLYMTVMPMGLCYLSWFVAVDELPAQIASTAMLLVPVIGVLAAGPILGEPLGMRELLALVLALGGIGFVMREQSGRM